MSLFRKKPRTGARQLLFDPVFACPTVPTVASLTVSYDTAFWVRLPTLGQDRTTWVEQVQAAHAEDLGWTRGTPEHDKIRAAAETIADTGLGYTASFISFPPGPTDFALAHVHVLDEELMLLEYGDPEIYLSFGDVKPDHFMKVQSFPQGWCYNFDTYLEPDTGAGRVVRAHKATPGVHLVGIGLGRGRSVRSGEILSLFARSRVTLTDGSEQ